MANLNAPEVTKVDFTGETQKEKVREIVKRIEAGILAVYNGENWRNYLKCLSKFHDYSANNALLIWMQLPQASRVAGFHDWRRKFGRSVKQGEKGIRILAPVIYPKKHKNEENGDEESDESEKSIAAFKVVSVFDYSQTEGKPLPTIEPDNLIGDVPKFDVFMASLQAVSPVPIGYETITTGARGYYHLEDRRIAIQEGMSQIQTVKTCIHETVHAKLHALDANGKLPPEAQDKHTREVQAEAIAFIVCARFGLDTSEYSFPYLAAWSTGRGLKELRASIDVIRKTAHELITGIDSHMIRHQIAC